RIGILTAILAALAVPASFAQSEARVRDELAVGRADIQADRQAILAANLPLTPDQSKAFWPVYREYRGEMSKLGDRLVELTLGFAKNYDTLTDEQASKMLNDFLSIQKDEARIKAEWVPKFGKVLPPKSLARFYQIENKLDTILRMDAAEGIPLVKAP